MSTSSNSGASAAGGSSGESYRESSGASAVGGSTETYRQSTDHDTDYGTDYGTDHSVPVRHEYVEPRTTQIRQEHVVHQAPPPAQQDSGPVNVAVGAERKDGVRWGPVWAGLLTALTTFLLLELMFYAFGWLTLDPGSNDSGNSSALVTGILALVAFFVGGLIAGATALHKGLFSGILHGFLVWALGVVAFIALTFFGASALLGSFGDLTNQLGVGPQQVQSTTELSDAEADEAAAATKDAAAPAFWGLFLPLGAAMTGGLIGSKIWPRKDDSDPETVQLRN